ncbi:MAG TPA: CPBP family intramembrane glutamic endopeptidase [Bryobacteraceae bacterium]|nr:CPBP family intramembrane glutamic endopeptidase [Bryobacteraceae bacterium]
MPNAVDLVFAAIVFVAGNLFDCFVIWPYMQRQVAAGDAGARPHVYGIIMAWLWVPTFFVAVRWWMLDRPWSALWFVAPYGWRLVASTLAFLATAALWHSQNRSAARLTAEKCAALLQRSANLIALVPHTKRDYRWFMAVSVTAGICEELLYRGFLVWELQPWLGLGLGAMVSIILFGACHAYQGKDVVRPIATGALLQGLALLTGSILPGMVVHAMLDAMSATSGYILVRKSVSSAQSAAGSSGEMGWTNSRRGPSRNRAH